MKAKHLFLLFLSAVFFTTCKKADDVPAWQKELVSFKLEAALNPDQLTVDIVGEISNKVVSLVIPDSVDAHALVATFTFKGKRVTYADVEQISGVTPNNFGNPLFYLTVEAKDGSLEVYHFQVTRSFVPKPVVVQMYIQTDGGAPIDSKDNYVGATLTYDGMKYYDDFEGRMKIKGRGNTTWTNYPKKPYRIKLDAAASILGLPAEKDWILLANYIDGTLMGNAIALKAGQLLDMPFTNHAVPVDVTLNGKFLGNYILTEQKEVGADRINIGSDGVLLEMDVNYDENWKFTSGNFHLPVMVQYPELDDMTSTDANAKLDEIKNDFAQMENSVNAPSFPNNNFLDYIDATSLVHYLIIYNLTLNEEINHPKSTYMYKKKGEKYAMGPIWDFDWAYGYEGTFQQFQTPDKPLFWTASGTRNGTVFFTRLLQSPAIRALYKTEWQKFKSQKLPQLIQYVDTYSELIRQSYDKNFNLWKVGQGNLDLDVSNIKSWLNSRAAYIDGYTAGW